MANRGPELPESFEMALVLVRLCFVLGNIEAAGPKPTSIVTAFGIRRASRGCHSAEKRTRAGSSRMAVAR